MVPCECLTVRPVIQSNSVILDTILRRKGDQNSHLEKCALCLSWLFLVSMAISRSSRPQSQMYVCCTCLASDSRGLEAAVKKHKAQSTPDQVFNRKCFRLHEGE